MGIISQLLPMAMPIAKKAIAPLATGALSGLASLGVDKIFGKGQRGGFLVSIDKIAQLVAYKHLLTTGQKKDILKSLHPFFKGKALGTRLRYNRLSKKSFVRFLYGTGPVANLSLAWRLRSLKSSLRSLRDS